jgi:hypothetical protein
MAALDLAILFGIMLAPALVPGASLFPPFVDVDAVGVTVIAKA